MYRVFSKISVALVIISMIANLLPQNIYNQIFATSTITTSAVQSSNSQASSSSNNINSSSERTIKAEIKSKRKENTKEFLNSDNTTTVAIYPNPVHYLKNGFLEDIDNSLFLSKNVNGNNVLENTANSFKARFAVNTKDTSLVEFSSDAVTFRWSLDNAKYVNVLKDDVKDNISNFNLKEAPSLVKNQQSGVTYSDILNNIDLSYEIISNEVKEKIILKSASSIDNKIVFSLDIGSLTAVLNQDKSISIKNDKGEVLSKIDAPFMYDAKLEFSSDVGVTLTKVGTIYKMEIIPSADWVKSKNRAFPIVIDPTVNTPLDYQKIQDTYIYAGDDANLTRYQAHIIRTGGGISKIFRSLVKFTLPTLNSGDQVVDAVLNTNNYPETYEWTPWTGPLQINVHRMTSDWQQETANWSNNSANYDSKIVDYNWYKYNPADPLALNKWNITSIVKDWYVSGKNYGLMLKQDTEAVTGHNEAYYLSSNTNAAAYLYYRPTVVITYRNQTGLEDYLSYTEQSIGRAGQTLVNNYNGNLTLIHPDFSTPGSVMPASVYHVYNSNDIVDDIGFGKGFRTNLSQTLQFENIGVYNYIKYVDEDATRHYFFKQEINNKYVDEDGLGLTITQNADSSFLMEDKSGNSMTFIKKVINGVDFWHLQQIKDSSGNKVTIEFLDVPSFFYISKITDNAGSTIAFNWANGRVVSITDQAGRNITYGYDATWNLTSITYPDSKVANYSYSGSLLTSIKNIDSSHIDYTYYATNPNRVNTVKEYSTANELGNGLTFNYGENITTLTDLKGFSNTYNFDDFGRATSVVDFGNANNNYSQAFGKAYRYGLYGGETNKITLESKLSTIAENKVLNSSAEYDGYWNQEVWGTTTGTASILATGTAAYAGNRVFKITNNTATAGAKVLYTQATTAAKGKTYTFSAYVKTSALNTSTTSGATLIAYYIKADGTVATKTAEYVTGTTDWTRLSVTIDYAADAKYALTLGIMVDSQVTTAYFDAAQLEEGTVANTYNYIENNVFDNGTLGFWTKNADASVSDTVVSQNSNNVLNMVGEATKRKFIMQAISVNGKSGDIFNFSSWVKNSGVKMYGDKASRVAIQVCGTAGQSEWKDFNISSDSNAWQFFSNDFKTSFDYNKIEIYLCYYYNSNQIFFDNLSLTKDDFGQSYSYDKNGNLITTQDLAKQNSSMQYNGKNELLSSTDAKGGNFVYEYDSNVKNRLLSAMNNSRIKYAFSYDNYGNVTNSTVTSGDSVAQTVTAGKTYFIRAKNSSLYFDVNGAIATEGTRVMQYWLHGGTNQQWLISDAGGGYFYLNPVFAKTMVLDVNATNGIQISNLKSATTQQFKLVKNTDNSYRIVAKSNENNCITIEKDSRDYGGNVTYTPYENLASQSFYFEEVGVNESLDKSTLESNEVYYLKSKSSGLYLDFEGNTLISTDTDGTKIIQNDYLKTKSQQFRFVRNANGSYKIIPISSLLGKPISVAGGINQNNQPVQSYSYVEGFAGEEWTIEKTQNNLYYINTNIAGTLRALTVSGNSTAIGANISITDKNYSATSQQWYLEPLNLNNVENNATYKIKASNTGNYVGIKNGTDVAGSNVELVAAGDTLGQNWKLVNLNNGYYKVVSANSQTGLVLDVYGNNSAYGTNIQTWTSNGTSGQQWEIVAVGNNLYTLKPRTTSGTCALEVAWGGTSVGSNIQIWGSNGTQAQQFYLEKVSVPTSEYIESKAEYVENGRFLGSITDSRSNKTTFTYNFSGVTGTGTLKSTTDAKANTTNYTYDNLDRITSVSMTTVGKTYTNSYSYVNDRISTITHNGFAMSFLYDNFGNTSQVKVGAQALVTNTYAAANGNLTKATYGNGQALSFAYDRFNRVSTKTATDGTYEYTYDAKSNLGVKKDNVNAVTTNYTYDLANRLVKSSSTNGFKYQYAYDNSSNVSNVKYSLNTIVNEVLYSVDADNMQTMTKWGTNYVMYGYDSLSRQKESNIKNAAGTYKTSYDYVNDATNALKTTTLLQGITNGANAKISYTYDTNGNIETITSGTTLTQKYYYDGLNQLIREDNKTLNKTIVYNYDIGGNITSKDTYAYDNSTQWLYNVL